jgi:hypothetical protein
MVAPYRVVVLIGVLRVVRRAVLEKILPARVRFNPLQVAGGHVNLTALTTRLPAPRAADAEELFIHKRGIIREGGI